MDEADNATLAFFTNPSYLGLLQRKLTYIPKTESDVEVIKFYRKRIISLFKDLFKNEIEGQINQEVKEAHRRFVATAIKHFEMVDTKDIVQGQHMTADAGEGLITPEDILNAIGSGGVDDDGDYTPAAANALMMRKTVVVPNLDNYVISIADPSAVRIIPLKIDFDLKAPELKTKGLKPKVKKTSPEEKK